MLKQLKISPVVKGRKLMKEPGKQKSATEKNGSNVNVTRY